MKPALHEAEDEAENFGLEDLTSLTVGWLHVLFWGTHTQFEPPCAMCMDCYHSRLRDALASKHVPIGGQNNNTYIPGKKIPKKCSGLGISHAKW